MLPTDVLNTLRALSLNERPLIQPLPDKDTSGKGGFELGQKVQGTIQSQVGNGVFRVRVLEQMMNMQLPTDLKSGDVIELQVMSLQPRLTFSLSASTNPLSTPDQLSNTSRLLSALAQQPQEQSVVRATQSAPLMSAATTNTTELAGKLQQSLSQSGLFYEAHQAQWIAGARSTAQLLQEPQNQLADPMQTAINKLNLAGNIVLNNETAPSGGIAQANVSTNAINSGRSVSQDSNSLSIPNQLQPIVQQQLNALETRQVLWQGQAWPNQTMDWEVHEESRRQQGGGYEEAGGQWATQVRMDLPNLGEVAAMLRFNSNGLSVTLDASGEQTRALFGAATSQLTAALAARGITVSSALVTPHGQS